LAGAAAKRLARLGVEVLTETKVEQVDAHGVVISGQRIESASVLWTAGVAPAPVLAELHTQTDRAGRICVLPSMEVPERPGIFVVGDAAALSQDGRPLPGVAQVAIQQGRYVGRLIRARIEGRTVTRPFRYFDKGNMAVVGRNFALLESGRLRMSGYLTWLIWGTHPSAVSATASRAGCALRAMAVVVSDRSAQLPARPGSAARQWL